MTNIYFQDENVRRKMFNEHGNPIMNEDGTQKAKPHYVYTIKQATEEMIILGVLRYPNNT